MADIELVVKIPEDTFFDLKKKQNRTEVDCAILNGTPLPKGHWIHHDEERWVCSEHWECSYCHETTMTNPMYPYNTYNHMYYCPKCRADMRESFEKLPRTKEEAEEAFLAYQRRKYIK